MESNPISKKAKIDAAPPVAIDTISQYKFINESKIMHNVPFAILSSEEAGPKNPYSKNRSALKNNLTGYVENHNMSNISFEEMQRTFHRDKYTVHPDGLGFIGHVELATERKGAMISDKEHNYQKPARQPKGKAEDIDGFLGPWAKYDQKNKVENVAGEVQEFVIAPTPVKQPEEAVPEVNEDEIRHKENTIFHGQSEHDYLGRSFMHVPTDLNIDLHGEPGNQECFVPKRCIHTWTGHTKGVNAIRFFPRNGHLLLSCSLDNTVKIWDCYHDRSLLRSYMGHNKAVKDISFNHDGSKFVSAGFDKWLKCWDTGKFTAFDGIESGKCVQTFTLERLPQCIRFNPNPEHADMFLTGCQDKKIYQFDARAGKLVQTYAQHVGAVNSITFNEDRFISTSDDKTVRVWEFGVPVVLKYIADPEMHSMPAAALSPSKKWLACQSLDNQIVIYSARDKYKINRTKKFNGHLVAGYSCQPSWSPDSRYLASGDSEGKVWFWDFRKGTMLKKFSGHTGVVVGSEWNPQEQSKVATCSWDGTIKYWD